MDGFEIGIIGGTGGIGRWFADCFRKEGYRVHVTGRREGMSLPELAVRCRIVIVSVPIAATLDVIRQVGPLLPEDSLLMDFTSLKEEPLREMLAATRAEVDRLPPPLRPGLPLPGGSEHHPLPGARERMAGLAGGVFRQRARPHHPDDSRRNMTG